MTEPVTIRATGKSDFADIDALLARSYPILLKAHYQPSVLVTALPIISRARPELVACGTYYMAETMAGQAVAAGGWTRSPNDAHVADIRHVVTDHRYARQGIARALFQHLFAQAQAAGIRHFDCMSTLTAVAFYQAMGFVERGQVDVQLAPGISFPAVRMHLRDKGVGAKGV